MLAGNCRSSSSFLFPPHRSSQRFFHLFTQKLDRLLLVYLITIAGKVSKVCFALIICSSPHDDVFLKNVLNMSPRLSSYYNPVKYSHCTLFYFYKWNFSFLFHSIPTFNYIFNLWDIRVDERWTTSCNGERFIFGSFAATCALLSISNT